MLFGSYGLDGRWKHANFKQCDLSYCDPNTWPDTNWLLLPSRAHSSSPTPPLSPLPKHFVKSYQKCNGLLASLFIIVCRCSSNFLSTQEVAFSVLKDNSDQPDINLDRASKVHPGFEKYYQNYPPVLNCRWFWLFGTIIILWQIFIKISSVFDSCINQLDQCRIASSNRAISQVSPIVLSRSLATRLDQVLLARWNRTWE